MPQGLLVWKTSGKALHFTDMGGKPTNQDNILIFIFTNRLWNSIKSNIFLRIKPLTYLTLPYSPNLLIKLLCRSSSIQEFIENYAFLMKKSLFSVNQTWNEIILKASPLVTCLNLKCMTVIKAELKLKINK